MGTPLSLDEHEFDALHMLASHEDKLLDFETLYEAVWKEEDGACERDSARLSLERLIAQVKTAGSGFMWIDHIPETGYVFRTRWGHNWRTRSTEG